MDALEVARYLRTPAAIRQRCSLLLALAEAGDLEAFAIDSERQGAVVEFVVAVIRETYPTLEIPYHSRWRHFTVGGVDRVAALDARLGNVDAAERARCMFDLVITSVLLDAGAGPAWSYHEEETGRTFDRSEGLAVASFRLFAQGTFSSDPNQPLRADASGLESVTADTLARGFQVTDSNVLVGLEGRAALIRRLGAALRASPGLFGADAPRVGNLFDALRSRAAAGSLSAPEVLAAVLDGLGSIWPGRVTLGEVNLGDVWAHPSLKGEGPGADLVPFHKLSQWLTYSLFEPLEAAGLTIEGIGGLTGLAEYRNGGLFVDLGLIVPKTDGILGVAHPPGSPVIVAWRALTVALLDRVADAVRAQLGLEAASFPLVKVLEGGTWAAGRRAARERRPDGAPPIRLESDGTVF